MEKVNRKSAKHYFWQDVCDGWHLVDRNDLSIIAEKMPPNTSEDMHYHRKARQFFYILCGQATMRFSDHTLLLNAGDGVEIELGEAHRICNCSDTEIEFLTVSMPKSHGDKVIVSSDI